MKPLLRSLYIALLLFCVALGIWIEEGNQRRREQARVDLGIYNVAPAVIHRLDCSVEGRRSCQAQQRMEKVKGKAT